MNGHELFDNRVRANGAIKFGESVRDGLCASIDENKEARIYEP